MVVATIVLAGALGIVLFKGSRSSSAGSRSSFEGSIPPAGVPPRDFKLVDQDGKTASLAAYRGRPVILSFMYSTCQDTCPIMAQQIKGALDDLGHDIPVLLISVDPANDSPLNAKRFLLKQHVTGRMRFLLGDRAQLAPVWKAYGIRPQGQGFEHTAYVMLIGRDGTQKVSWPADKLTPGPLARDLARL